MNLDRDVFLALSTVIWASSDVTPSEASSLCEAARTCGIAGEDLRAIDRAASEPVCWDDIGLLALDDMQRVFVYGLASWLARANGGLIDAERGGRVALDS